MMIIETGSGDAKISRFRRLRVADSQQLGAWLQRLGATIANRRGDAMVFVLILNDDDEPEAHVVGWNPNGLTRHDIAGHLNHFQFAVSEWLSQPASRDVEGDDTGEDDGEGDGRLSLTEVLRQRIATVTAAYQRHDQRQVAAKPWQCDHCTRRYKTENGAVQHERQCVNSAPDGHGLTSWNWMNRPGHVVATCRCGREFVAPIGKTRAAANRKVRVAAREHFNTITASADDEPSPIGPRLIG